MATETQQPDVLQVQTNLTGAVTDIDDDPDSPDGNWLTAPNNVTTTCRVSFPTPTGNPNTGAGLQEFRVLVRETSTNNGRADEAVSVFLYENGSQVGTVLATASGFGTAGTVISATWDAADLANADGSLVECHVVGTPEGGGGPSTRGSVEIGAIEWNVDYSTGTVKEATPSASSSFTASVTAQRLRSATASASSSFTGSATAGRLAAAAASATASFTASLSAGAIRSATASASSSFTASATASAVTLGAVKEATPSASSSFTGSATAVPLAATVPGSTARYEFDDDFTDSDGGWGTAADQNVSFVTGQRNSAARFVAAENDRLSRAVPTADRFNTQGAYTWSFWIDPASDGELNAGRIFEKGNNPGVLCATINEAGGNVAIQVTWNGWSGGDSTFVSAVSPVTVPIGDYTHVICTVDTATSSTEPIQIFFNGIKQTLTSVVTSTGSPGVDSTDTIYIGDVASFGRALDADLDNLRFWPGTKLTQGEAYRLYLDEFLFETAPSAASSFTGSVTAQRLRQATASASSSFTGSITAGAIREAIASAASSFTGSVTAGALRAAAASASSSFTGSVTAGAIREAIASAASSFTGSATATSVTLGTVKEATPSASSTFAGSVTGQRLRSATASAASSFTGSLTAGAIRAVAASAASSFTGSATATTGGAVLATASAASSFTGSLTAGAVRAATASATASLSAALSAGAVRPASASAALTLNKVDFVDVSQGSGGGATSYSFTITDTPIDPGSLRVVEGGIGWFWTDNGDGTLSGSGVGDGTVDYETGEVTIEETLAGIQDVEASWTQLIKLSAGALRPGAASAASSLTGSLSAGAIRSVTASASSSFAGSLTAQRLRSVTASASSSFTGSLSAGAIRSVTASASASFTGSAAATTSGVGLATATASASFVASLSAGAVRSVSATAAAVSATSATAAGRVRSRSATATIITASTVSAVALRAAIASAASSFTTSLAAGAVRSIAGAAVSTSAATATATVVITDLEAAGAATSRFRTRCVAKRVGPTQLIAVNNLTGLEAVNT